MFLIFNTIKTIFLFSQWIFNIFSNLLINLNFVELNFVLFNTIFKIFFLYTVYMKIFLQLVWPLLGFCMAPLNISSGYGFD